MNNVLRQIETEDIVFIESISYGDIDKERFLSVFKALTDDGVIKSRYEDMCWVGYSGVKHCIMSFEVNKFAYMGHFQKKVDIPFNQFIDMLKCYALYEAGEFILLTIKEHMLVVREFAERVGEKKYHITDEKKEMIKSFLRFISVSDYETNRLLKLVHIKDEEDNSENNNKRELANLINYLAIANEIDRLFSTQISDEDFVRWYPVYFWVNVTFIIPLRATEMLLTPFDCFETVDGKLFIRLRRSLLKKQMNTVYYNVEKDYRIFIYQIPNIKLVKITERYRVITGEHKRKYLFDYNKYSINKMYSLQRFNELLASFIRIYLIGNRRYDYARHASGIKEFEPVTAGDSRPIAMSNLYFQEVGADTCRQLADHMNLSTSEKYYTNVANTIYASSIMQLQRKLNNEREMTAVFERDYSMHQGKQFPVAHASDKGCFSPKRPFATGDISDCIAQNHIHECLGCTFFHPTEKQLNEALEERRKRLEKDSYRVLKQMADKNKIKSRENDFDKIFLDAHTSIKRYQTVCDEKACMEMEKWHRKNTIQMTSSWIS